MKVSNMQRAEILTQALPYIQRYNGKIVVIKYGGNAMTSDALRHQVMEDIVLLTLIGVRVVLVHGGGPEITQLLDKMGKESVFVDGLRVTDRETAEAAQMVLAGKTGKNLVNLLCAQGGRAMGICGIDGHMIHAEQKDERLGYVGRITAVDVTPITDLLEKGYIPVVSTLGCDSACNVYNINADTAAARIAGALRAESLVSLTDIAGVFMDRDDPGTLIPCMDIAQAEELFRRGVISGGMIPKMECCIDAIHCGVKKVIILDGRVPHALLLELLTDEGAGTMVVEHMRSTAQGEEKNR